VRKCDVSKKFNLPRFFIINYFVAIGILAVVISLLNYPARCRSRPLVAFRAKSRDRKVERWRERERLHLHAAAKSVTECKIYALTAGIFKQTPKAIFVR